jgi:hypothetical protein
MARHNEQSTSKRSSDAEWLVGTHGGSRMPLDHRCPESRRLQKWVRPENANSLLWQYFSKASDGK